MQEGAQTLGLLGSEDQARAVGARGLLPQAGEPRRIAGRQRIEHRLVVDAQIRRDAGSALATGAGQDHLAAAQDEGIWSVQALLQRLPLFLAERSNKDGW